MKIICHSFAVPSVAVLCVALCGTVACIAQDPGAQATQLATQAAQQATQQTQQAAQRAQQNMQTAMQQAAQQSGQSSSSFPLPTDLPPVFPQQPTGPLPAQIASAHNVLLINAGVSPRLAVDSNQVYNDIHAQLATWGHFQLVSTPEQADLVFQLSVVDPRIGFDGQGVPDAYGRSPLFVVTILDAHTSTPLWSITSPLYLVGKGQTAAHWMALSEDNLVSRIKVLSHQSLSAGESAQLTTYPKNHRALVGGLIAGGFVGLAVGGYFIAHREFEDSLANQKASQDAFCNANHIPLSECAGG